MRSARLLPALLSCLAYAGPAYAYIDPNIGGQLAQIIAPIVTVVIGVLAFARQWLRSMFARLSARARAFVSRARD